MKAVWRDTVLAESDRAVFVQGNYYFPPESIKREFFELSETNTNCPWKGEASYYNIKIGNETNSAAAWFYTDPKEAAKEIKDYVAFWKGVVVEE